MIFICEIHLRIDNRLIVFTYFSYFYGSTSRELSALSNGEIETVSLPAKRKRAPRHVPHPILNVTNVLLPHSSMNGRCNAMQSTSSVDSLGVVIPLLGEWSDLSFFPFFPPFSSFFSSSPPFPPFLSGESKKSP
jgi:hypothetical protein